MRAWQTRAGVNVKLLVIALVVLIALGAGAFAVHRARKAGMVREARTAGLAAYEAGDWAAARQHLSRYLAVHRDEPDLLRKYAYAHLQARPLVAGNIDQAANSYRLILRDDPGNDEAFERLVLIYQKSGNMAELGHVAERRLAVPGLAEDAGARLALARAQAAADQDEEARQTLVKLIEDAEGAAEKPEEYLDACLMLAGLAAREGAGDEARRWLDMGVESGVETGRALVQRASLLRTLAARQDDGATQAQLEQVRADLNAAREHIGDAAELHLLLCQEWTALGDFDRAAEHLAAARAAPWEDMQDVLLDPVDWTVALFERAAVLAAARGDAEAGTQLVNDTLKELEGRPQRLQLLPMATRLYIAAGKTDEARKCLDEYLDALTLKRVGDVGDEQVAVLRAMIAEAEREPHRVIELLEPHSRKATTSPVVLRLLAAAYSASGQPGRVAALATRNPAQFRGEEELARLAARGHLTAGRWAEADAVLAPVAARKPDDLELQLMRATAAYGVALTNNAPAEALAPLQAKLEALQEQMPEDLTATIVLSAGLETKGDTEQAEAILRRGLEQNPDSVAASVALARFLARYERFDEAADVLNATREAHPEDATAWQALADFQASRGDLEAAAQTLEAAEASVTGADAKRQIAIRRALFVLEQGKEPEAISRLEAVAQAHPDDADVRGLLLQMPAVAQDAARAERLIADLREIEGEPGLRWRYHQAQHWLGQPDWSARRSEAIELLQYCVEADPSWAAPVLLLGQLYERVGELNKAAALYTNGFAATRAAVVGERLLELLQRQGRFNEARQVLAELSRLLDPEAMRLRRAGLAAGAGELGEAIRELSLHAAGQAATPDEHILLARLEYEHTGNLEKALAHLEQATAAGAPPLVVAQVRAGLLQEEGDTEGARAVLDEIVAADPTPEAYRARAALAYTTGDLAQAEADFKEYAKGTQDAAGVAVLGEFYAQSGRLSDAIVCWQAGLEAYPKNATLLRGLAKALLVRGQPEDDAAAREYVQTLLDAGEPRDVDVLRVLALLEARAGGAAARARVLALAKEALEAPPAGAEAYAGLAQLALEQGDAQNSRNLAARGLQIYPREGGLQLAQARADFQLGNKQSAQAAVRQILAEEPDRADAIELAVQMAIGAGDAATLEQFIPKLAQRVQDQPESAQWILLHAAALQAAGRVDEALALLEQKAALPALADNIGILLRLADLHAVKQQPEEAAAALDRAAAAAPGNPNVLRARLALLGQQRKHDEIVQLMEQETAAVDAAPGLLLVASAALSGSPHQAQALEYVETYAQRFPEDVAGLLALGDMRYQAGDVTGAETAYRRIIEIMPKQASALNNLAWIRASHYQDFEQAAKLSREAVLVQPEDANFRDTLAFILRHIPGQLPEARREYERCLALAGDLSPLRERTLFELARTSATIGDAAASARYAEQALASAEQANVFSPAERQELESLRKAATP